MQMKTIIAVCFIASLAIAGVFVFINHGIDGLIPSKALENEGHQNESRLFSNHVEFTQDDLQLREEVVQFKITFHADDVVNVSRSMYVYNVDETITSVYCVLTDGENVLLEPRTLWFIPERKYALDTPRIRLSIGKYWFVKLINDREGKIRLGSATNDSGCFDAHTGDTWYITMAVPTTSEKSGFSVILTAQNNSMEVTRLTRHSNIGLYTATFNQFSGNYYSIKIRMLFSFTLCNIFREIFTKDGSIIDMTVAGHRKGTLTVNEPTEEVEQFVERRLIIYRFIGNETGTWKFSIKGWGFFYRMHAVLVYIDIDPHCKNLEIVPS